MIVDDDDNWGASALSQNKSADNFKANVSKTAASDSTEDFFSQFIQPAQRSAPTTQQKKSEVPLKNGAKEKKPLTK